MSQPATSTGSVGLVVPTKMHFAEPFTLASGDVLPSFDLMVETYGTLNDDHSNAVLIAHALSGNHHAAGFHSPDDKRAGWWDVCIGPGKPIDTDRFFVVSLNNIGGCHGSTGPCTTNPATGIPYGPEFPVITVKDWVASQALLADRLEIEQWAAVVGGSLGGMQAMRWAIDYPDRLRHAVLIASAAKLSTQNIAFNEIARQCIISDPEFAGGNYYANQSSPREGLKVARMVGHVTYQSADGLGEKFGRDLRSGDIDLGLDVQFQVESYLQHQGSSFSEQFDANTYVLMTRALDYFDPARDFDDNLTTALAQATCDFLCVSFSTDWRFSPRRSEEIVEALINANRNVSYACVEAAQGHDAFLLPVPRYLKVLDSYMRRVAEGINNAT